MIVEPIDDGRGDLTLSEWCAQIAWAVTTESECYGLPPDDSGHERYAIYDANEDDPPIAVCSIREDAEHIAEALIRVGREAKGE